MLFAGHMHITWNTSLCCIIATGLGFGLCQSNIVSDGNSTLFGLAPVHAHQGRSSPNLESTSGRLPKFNWEFLVCRHNYGKSLINIQTVSPEVWAEVWNNVLSCNVEESFKKNSRICISEFFYPKGDDFQNLISSLLSTDTSLVHFSNGSDQ